MMQVVGEVFLNIMLHVVEEVYLNLMLHVVGERVISEFQAAS